MANRSVIILKTDDTFEERRIPRDDPLLRGMVSEPRLEFRVQGRAVEVLNLDMPVDENGNGLPMNRIASTMFGDGGTQGPVIIRPKREAAYAIIRDDVIARVQQTIGNMA
eukprot:m.31709 g.31709  ORF g.31709 m.31709 type:complete len:110 (-) comp6961_c0_seq1:158-487(-)